MTEPAITPIAAAWTEADLETFPDNGNRYEIIEGRLIVTPPPTNKHGSLQIKLGVLLDGAGSDNYDIVAECGVRVPDGNLIADLAVLHTFGPEAVTWQEARAVALVVEIASPSSAQFDATDKLAAYARAGIPNYWRVEQDGTVHVYELAAGEYSEIEVVRPGSEWTASEPFKVTLRPADWIRQA